MKRGTYGHAALSADGSDLLDQSALGLLLAHGLHCGARHVDETEEVDFHLSADLGV